MRPNFRLRVGEADVTERLREYVLSIAVQDGSGTEADKLDLLISDPLERIAWPQHGQQLHVELGYDELSLRDMGSYVVDEVEISNPPRQIRIRGNSINLRDSTAKRRARLHYQNTTVGEIVQALAEEMQYTAAITPSLARQPVTVWDRISESPMSAVTRLARRFDAVATVKRQHLTFVPAGEGVTASGAAIPPVTVEPEAAVDWRFSIVDRGKYTAVEARYRDQRAAEDVWVRAGTDNTDAGDNTLRLRQTYPDRISAESAARGRLKALNRNAGSGSLTLVGDVRILGQTPLTLQRFGPGIDGEWIADEVVHRFDSGSGYTTRVQVTLPADGAESLS